MFSFQLTLLGFQHVESQIDHDGCGGDSFVSGFCFSFVGGIIKRKNMIQ
jgi:hypothetical protein